MQINANTKKKKEGNFDGYLPGHSLIYLLAAQAQPKWEAQRPGLLSAAMSFEET